jgi:hypothetical protein
MGGHNDLGIRFIEDQGDVPATPAMHAESNAPQRLDGLPIVDLKGSLAH